MNKFKILSALSVLAIAVGLLGFAPSMALPAQATGTAAASIVYNLYATDGFIPLADGSAVYNYGFVGGRQGVPLTYQKSVTPGGDRAADTELWTSFTYNGNGTIPTGAPAPTGGPVTAAEAPAAGQCPVPGAAHLCRGRGRGGDPPQEPGHDASHRAQRPAQHPPARAGRGRGQRRRPGDLGRRHPANLCRWHNDCRGRWHLRRRGQRGRLHVLAQVPGHYMYHCHQEADIHVQMGMYGALVVYSANDKGNAKSAYNKGGPGSGFGGNAVRLEVRQGLRAAGVRDWHGLSTSPRRSAATIIPWTTSRSTGSSTACPSRTRSTSGCRGERMERLDRRAPGLRPVHHRQRQHEERRRHQGREGPDPHDQHGLRDPAHAHARLPRQGHRLGPAGLVLGERSAAVQTRRSGWGWRRTR